LDPNEADLSSWSLDQLCDGVSRLHDELDLSSAGLDVANRVSANLSALQGAQAVSIGRLAKAGERREAEVRARQEQVLAWNGKNNAASEEFTDVVRGVVAQLGQFGGKSSNRREMFVAEFGSGDLEAAEREFKKEFETFVRKQFDRKCK
jgi:hypothetical protein